MTPNQFNLLIQVALALLECPIAESRKRALEMAINRLDDDRMLEDHRRGTVP